jgi:hypothetical protein
MHSFWGFLPLDSRLDMHYEVVLQGDAQGQVTPLYEVLCRQEALPGKPEPFKFLEARGSRRWVFNRQQQQLIPFDEPGTATDHASEAPARAETTSGQSVPLRAQEPSLLLSQMRFFNEYPIPSSARTLLAGMAFYPGFDVSRGSTLRRKPAEIGPWTMLLPTGENLGTVLHELLTRYEYRSAANDVREFLRSAYASFEDIHCDTARGTPAQVLVRIREKGMQRSTEIWELSDGMLRFLCLAAALLNPQPPPFIAVDEPESGLHPRLLPIVGDMIKAAAEGTQVLVTTHSPDLLNRFDIEHIAVMTRGDESVAKWNRPADRATLVEMLKDVGGETVGDLHRSGELEALA